MLPTRRSGQAGLAKIRRSCVEKHDAQPQAGRVDGRGRSRVMTYNKPLRSTVSLTVSVAVGPNHYIN